MRIISKFQDYYDSAMGLGIDPTLVYVRTTMKGTVADYTLTFQRLDGVLEDLPRSLSVEHSSTLSVSCGILGFCGKLYPIMTQGVGDNRKFFSTPEQMFKHMEQEVLLALNTVGCNVAHLDRQSYRKFEKEFETGREGWYRDSLSRKTFYEWGEEVNKANNIIDIFFEIEAPMFILYGTTVHRYRRDLPMSGKVIVNPCLKDAGFASIIDPYTAYQELSMFMGGVLPRHKDPPQITDDKVLRDSKGFHNMSFKTRAPGKKSKNK